jgi:hypothetical protein
MEILKTLGGLALTAVAVVTIIGKASFFTASSMPHVKIEAADLPTRVVMTNMGIRLPDSRLEVF